MRPILDRYCDYDSAVWRTGALESFIVTLNSVLDLSLLPSLIHKIELDQIQVSYVILFTFHSDCVVVIVPLVVQNRKLIYRVPAVWWIPE